MSEKDGPDPITDVPEGPPVEQIPPVLAMDGIRIATLVMLGVHTVAVVVLSVFLVTNVQEQRQVNECYQDLLDDVVAWANAAVTAGTSNRQAQRELLLAQESGIDRRVAIERYLDQLDQADRTRSTAPVPAQRCTR